MSAAVLTRDERIANVQKLGLSRGVAELLDVGDPLVRRHLRGAHKASTWAVNSRPSHSARRPRVVELTP